MGVYKKKAKKLLTPYVLLTSIVFVPKVIFSKFAARPLDGGIESFLISIMNPSMNPIQPLWFLIVLFGVYVLGWMMNNLYLYIGFYKYILLGVICMILSYFLIGVDFIGFSAILYFTPYFCVGIICKRYKLLSLFPLDSVFMAMISLCFLSIFCMYPMNKYILALIGITNAISFIGLLYTKNVSFFPYLRKFTFCIYLLQWFPMAFVRVILFNILGWNLWLCYALMFIGGLFVPILCALVVLKLKDFTPNAYRFLKIAIGLP